MIKTIAVAIIFIFTLISFNHEIYSETTIKHEQILQNKTTNSKSKDRPPQGVKKDKNSKKHTKLKNSSESHNKKASKKKSSTRHSKQKYTKKHDKKSFGKDTADHSKNVASKRRIRKMGPYASKRQRRQKAGCAGYLNTASNSVLVYDDKEEKILYGKNINAVVPIASITKLMTAMVLLDAGQPMDEDVTITDEDVDKLRNSASRLEVGTTLSRGEMLRLALMSSENRAASALARNYPGGMSAFVAAMNQKARALGMANTNFRDPTGLHEENVSTAEDLLKMVKAASSYETIGAFTTTAKYQINDGRRCLIYNNTNALVKRSDWKIRLSKTGFINESRRCLVMKTEIVQRPIIIVLLDAPDTQSRTEDALNIKRWLEGVS
ncbi:MAG: serine hydrolase [Dissulfurimicrobium sp.]|uniref:serine hydrolase n=1 Tax=Dissulfurimicrobium sp. TaxID=2022436 RepID=UPI004049E072